MIVCACARNVTVEGSSPAPLIEALPLSIAVYYSPAFRDASHRVERVRERTWIVDYGGANVRLFDDVLFNLFERVTHIERMPENGSALPGIDAILEPRIEEYAVLTPGDSGQNYYAASVKYQFLLFAPDGRFIASWPLNAYGKSPRRMFREKQSLRRAGMLAIRDAAAALALEFDDQQQVRAWLDEKGVSYAQGR